jgi:peptidoglycan/xylan/chitin deacetylase (PgdA/CDA1 family)
MPDPTFALRQALKRTLRSGPAHGLAVALAARRGHALTLLVHRVGAAGPADHEVVRTVPLEVLRAQLDVLAEVAEVVPAATLAHEPRGASSRPRVALTFDDDYASQLLAARELAERGLPGTVFLSGRALHGLGAYWWEVLEARLLSATPAEVAGSLGLPPVATPQELAARVEGTPLAAELAAAGDATPADHLDAEGIAELAGLPGITVGFHTVRHEVLPLLDPDRLDEALRLGVAALAEAVDRPVELLAYPHGKASPAVARAAAAAGFRFGWTGRIAPTTAAADPHLLPRWEPHELPADEFAAQLVVRLNRADPNA